MRNLDNEKMIKMYWKTAMDAKYNSALNCKKWLKTSFSGLKGGEEGE